MDVDQAMRAVPRADFLRPAERERADEDGPLPIGEGQTSSQPRTVAAMLRLLDVRAGHRVLDVGAGSGWTTALLAQMVGPAGWVLGIELSPALAAWGGANIARRGQEWSRLREATPGELGSPADGPYDRILCSAEADRLPGQLVEQLAPGGVLVVPVVGEMLRVVADQTGALTTSCHGAYRFVPLR